MLRRKNINRSFRLDEKDAKSDLCCKKDELISPKDEENLRLMSLLEENLACFCKNSPMNVPNRQETEMVLQNGSQKCPILK